MRMRRGGVILRALGAVSIAIGTICGCVVLSIAFDNNNQGEYFDPATGQIHFDTVLPLFLMVAAPVSLIAFVVNAFIRSVIRCWREFEQR